MCSTPEESMKDTTIQGREIGYARVSKTEQHLALQLRRTQKASGHPHLYRQANRDPL